VTINSVTSFHPVYCARYQAFVRMFVLCIKDDKMLFFRTNTNGVLITTHLPPLVVHCILTTPFIHHPSLFRSGLRTFLFRKSFSPLPLFSSSGLIPRIPGLFTDTSEHTDIFYFSKPEYRPTYKIRACKNSKKNSGALAKRRPVPLTRRQVLIY